MNRVQQIGFGLVFVVGSVLSVPAAGQESGESSIPNVAPLPVPENNPAGSRRQRRR